MRTHFGAGTLKLANFLNVLRYGRTERVTRVRGVENLQICIGNHWFGRVDALHPLKQRVRRVLRT